MSLRGLFSATRLFSSFLPLFSFSLFSPFLLLLLPLLPPSSPRLCADYARRPSAIASPSSNPMITAQTQHTHTHPHTHTQSMASTSTRCTPHGHTGPSPSASHVSELALADWLNITPTQVCLASLPLSFLPSLYAYVCTRF